MGLNCDFEVEMCLPIVCLVYKSRLRKVGWTYPLVVCLVYKSPLRKVVWTYPPIDRPVCKSPVCKVGGSCPPSDRPVHKGVDYKDWARIETILCVRDCFRFCFRFCFRLCILFFFVKYCPSFSEKERASCIFLCFLIR